MANANLSMLPTLKNTFEKLMEIFNVHACSKQTYHLVIIENK